MNLPIEELTPREIVAELDRYIVGQDQAKRAVAIALRNRFRRQRLPAEQGDEIVPKNILMIGPTGVGKTEIARRLAQLARAPFVKVEATKFTEVGYVGRDVDSMVRDLVNISIRIVEAEKTADVAEEASRRAIDRIVEILVDPYGSSRTTSNVDNPFMRQAMDIFGESPEAEKSAEPVATETDDEAAWKRRREKVRKQIESGSRDAELIEIEIEDAATPFVQVFSPQGMEEMGLDLPSQMGSFGRSRSTKLVSIGEAKAIIGQEEGKKLIDQHAVTREAVLRTEQTGIIFIDELDKIAGREGGSGPDVSREGVQRDLLPIIEGSTVATKYGPVKTDHILFIGAGAFHMSKPSDLIPELQGRLPIRVELQSLGEQDLRRILREPKNAITKQYQQLLSTEGVALEFTDDAVEELARMAHEVNSRAENIGARRLHTVMEKLLEDIMFDAPEVKESSVRVDADLVRERLSEIIQDVDLSKYIL
ncbi:MAG: ATP-dependent protease ATPase subunit HslU [Fimbriimonadales bacterium]